MAGVRGRRGEGGERPLVPALQFAPRRGSELTADAAEFADAVAGAYAFSATLAIQDITGLATSGVTPSHITKRLEGSAESQALLFAITSRVAPRPVTDLGFPELTRDDLLDIDAWVFVSIPLLEDRGVIEANVTLDAAIAPLPGEPVPTQPWLEACSLIDALSTHLDRPIRQLWVTHQPGSWQPPGVVDAGYAPAFREDQAVFDADAAGRLGRGAADAARADADAVIEVVEGPGFAGFAAPVGTGVSRDAEQFGALLSAASRDYPRGDLALEPIEWDLARITDAGARLMDRGGAQLTGVARVGGRIVGLCEAVQYASDDDAVCELGLIYVLPEHRRRGIGTSLVKETLAAAQAHWEELETVYLSYPAGSAPAEAIAHSLNARVVSSTTAWQKRY